MSPRVAVLFEPVCKMLDGRIATGEPTFFACELWELYGVAERVRDTRPPQGAQLVASVLCRGRLFTVEGRPSQVFSALRAFALSFEQAARSAC